MYLSHTNRRGLRRTEDKDRGTGELVLTFELCSSNCRQCQHHSESLHPWLVMLHLLLGMLHLVISCIGDVTSVVTSTDVTSRYILYW